jgi:hypothetical protein
VLVPALFFLGAILVVTEDRDEDGIEADDEAIWIACAPYLARQMSQVRTWTSGMS